MRGPSRQSSLATQAGRALVAAVLAAASSCSRTGIDTLDLAAYAGADGSDSDAATPTGPSGACVATGAESCNGVDDDCNGLVDDLPSIPCPGGGERYCIAGHFSECPRRCDACFPGAEVVCFITYCKYWGVETCASDGKTLSGCKEKTPPGECAAIAGSDKRSAELEQCCIDAQYCCADDFDLDHDGITDEYLGRCDQVSCGP